MNDRNPSATPGPPTVDGPHDPEHDPKTCAAAMTANLRLLKKLGRA